MAKKRYETTLTEDCIKKMRFLKAHYNVDHLNETIEILVREKYKEIFEGETKNDMEHTNH